MTRESLYSGFIRTLVIIILLQYANHMPFNIVWNLIELTNITELTYHSWRKEWYVLLCTIACTHTKELHSTINLSICTCTCTTTHVHTLKSACKSSLTHTHQHIECWLTQGWTEADCSHLSVNYIFYRRMTEWLRKDGEGDLKNMGDGGLEEITTDWGERRVRIEWNREKGTKIISKGVKEREKDVILMREGDNNPHFHLQR